MKPLISIIVPCYNSAEYLPQCMISLEQQTIGVENLQLIFVDDASTDDGRTWCCILEFEQKHPLQVVAVSLERNRSQGGARNVGLEYAEAEYTGFVDSDDWVEPDMYQKLYEKIKTYHCDAVDCRIIMDTVDGRQIIYHKGEDVYDAYEKSIMDGGTHWKTDFFHKSYGGGIVTGIYRTDIIRDNHILFPENLKYEDNYWIAILVLYVRSFYHLAEGYYHYRQRATSTVHARNERHHLDQLKIEEKKLQKYISLGIYDRYRSEIERDFLKAYYCRNLAAMCGKFDTPSYEVFCEMSQRVRTLFPDYNKNPYFQENSIYKILLGLIDKKVNEKQFKEIGEMIKNYCMAEEKINFWSAQI